LNFDYVENGFDIPTFETSIEIDGRVKRVKHHKGLRVGMPMSVLRLENAIDQFAGTSNGYAAMPKLVTAKAYKSGEALYS